MAYQKVLEKDSKTLVCFIWTNSPLFFLNTGSRKTKSQQEQSTKSRAKKVVRGISSEQIGLIQEVWRAFFH